MVAARRAVALGLALGVNIVHFWIVCLSGRLTLERRARWLHASCRRVMAAMGIRCRAQGEIPAHGLVVSNHLSHIDILIYGAIMPCFFVSKAEVAFWPYFGRAARSGGTLFIDRKRRASAGAVAQEMARRLALPIPVLLFPEGTSTDGSRVLRFHTWLFEPAIAAGAPVTAAAIRYVIHDGTPERALCWFGNELFLPHLWRALGTRGFSAEVTFAEPRKWADRRTAALGSHDQVSAIRSDQSISSAGSIPSLVRND